MQALPSRDDWQVGETQESQKIMYQSPQRAPKTGSGSKEEPEEARRSVGGRRVTRDRHDSQRDREDMRTVLEQIQFIKYLKSLPGLDRTLDTKQYSCELDIADALRNMA